MAKAKQPHFRFRTRHLILETATEEEMELLIEMSDGEMAAAYSEMLEGCRSHPDQYQWYCVWKMMRKEDSELIGDLCFKGLPGDGTVEIGYGIFPEYEGQGYTTEAVKTLCTWALSNQAVDVVFGETAPDNVASQHVLLKAGFVPLGQEGEEGPRYYLEADKPVWMSVFMCLGISFGIALGSITGLGIGPGMPIGIGLGIAVGSLLDSRERKRRAAYRQRLNLPTDSKKEE